MKDDSRLHGATRWWRNPALAHAAFGTSTLAGHDPALAAEPDLSDPAQSELGEYELLELIGRGGMGLVYRARQRGLAREVAIKLLSGGPWASPEFVARFRQEARHAARLQHPGIVAIHELGESDAGVYYAMQLVRGQSLAQRLHAQGPWPARPAAALLRKIAEAVAYAHSLGVLHLDLKPGNVLLDEDGQPLIADFGLARRTEAPGNDATIAGTPGYMAPEQTVPGRALSEATDIWALGAILHELLTGQPPGMHPDAALGAIHADLRAVCRHCLQADPTRRYPGARALADDLGRFLEGRAVSARRLNALQRIDHWRRREPRLALAIAFALLALVAGLAASLWLMQRARHNAQQAQAVNRFLNEDVLARANPDLDIGRDGSSITVAHLLAGAESRLDSGLEQQPGVRAQTGLSIGRAYFGLGLWNQAAARLKIARRDATAAFGDDSPLALDIEEKLGLALTYSGDYGASEALYQHLLATRRARNGPDAPATIAAMAGHAALLYESDRFEEAIREYEAAQGLAITHAPEQLIDINWNLAEIYPEVNRWDEAERLVRNALAKSRSQLGPRNPRYLWQTQSLVDILNMRAQWDEAEALAADTRAKLVEVVGADHPKTYSATHYLGQIQLARGHPAQALPLLQETLRGRIRVHGEGHKWTQFTMNRVGEALLALHRPHESIAMLDRALDLATRAGRRRQPYVLLILDNLARAHMALDQMDRAKPYVDEALANAAQSHLPANNLRRGMVERLAGDFDTRQGRIEAARRHYRNALAIFAPGFGTRHPWVREIETRLATLSTKAQEHRGMDRTAQTLPGPAAAPPGAAIASPRLPARHGFHRPPAWRQRPARTRSAARSRARARPGRATPTAAAEPAPASLARHAGPRRSGRNSRARCPCAGR